MPIPDALAAVSQDIKIVIFASLTALTSVITSRRRILLSEVFRVFLRPMVRSIFQIAARLSDAHSAGRRDNQPARASVHTIDRVQPSDAESARHIDGNTISLRCRLHSVQMWDSFESSTDVFLCPCG